MLQRLLNMLGEQAACAPVYAGAFAVNLIACIALIPRFGMTGAAASVSAALIVESIALFWVTKCRLQLHVFILGGRKRNSILHAGQRGRPTSQYFGFGT